MSPPVSCRKQRLGPILQPTSTYEVNLFQTQGWGKPMGLCLSRKPPCSSLLVGEEGKEAGRPEVPAFEKSEAESHKAGLALFWHTMSLPKASGWMVGGVGEKVGSRGQMIRWVARQCSLCRSEPEPHPQVGPELQHPDTCSFWRLRWYGTWWVPVCVFGCVNTLGHL